MHAKCGFKNFVTRHHSEEDNVKYNIIIFKYARDVGCENLSGLNWLRIKSK
jgi:hypothetical protein